MAESPFQTRRGPLLRLPHNGSATNVSLHPDEFEQMKNSANQSQRLLELLQNRTAQLPANDEVSMSDTMFSADDNIERGQNRTDVLFRQFLEVLQSHGNDSETFQVLKELLVALKNVVDQLQVDIDRGMGGAHGTKQREASIDWLKQEINTWSLLHALYFDRHELQAETGAEDEMQEGPTLGGSEKEVITQLYAINATLREYQVVVDWLEASHDDKEHANALHAHDRMVAWENTLFQLENLQGAAFGKGHEIVKQLDPDAPVREKKPLHALDEEDNLRLARAIFWAVRRGRSDDALKLCKHFGQTWRAAILEGWRLHEDPNYGNAVAVAEKLPIEGNPRRDVWKKCAWMMADSKKYDEYTRATAGIFCGHLASVKSLLKSSWHDLLWAYLKVQIDIRVESEIRACCMKRYHPMPDDYWKGKMTLEQIFDELAVAKDVAVRDYAQSQLGIIQQHVILDSCGELLQHMCRWLDAHQPMPPQQLRFITHIVLFLRQIRRVEHEPHAQRIIAAYVEALIKRGDAQLIAYYTAALPNEMQVQLYSKFLQQVEQKQARDLALDAALQIGLDLEQITRHTVESICQDNSGTFATREDAPRLGEISAGDGRKINALQWLTHLPEQTNELLWQANALMRHFLSASKIECVRKTFCMVPAETVGCLIELYGSLDNLPPREECSIKEYLCYKIYLAGVDSFNEWTRLQQSRPQPPPSVAQANFTERMASEHREQSYRNELTRWEHKVKEQCKLTTVALYNVLLFPEKGWLNDPFLHKLPENAAMLNWEQRQMQMEKLRSICLPEIALLLHEVMYKSGDYEGCVRLGDEIANERRQLYKVYPKHKLAELLSKIADASVELLNAQLDPWGYPFTA